SSTNGPEPTTSESLANVVGSSTFSQMCFGTIGISEPGFGACGVFRVMTTVLSSGVSTVSKFDTRLPLAVPSAGTVSIWSYVYFTSAEVIGSPSDHTRSSCSVKVQVWPPSVASHESARPLVGEPSSASFCTSDSYTYRMMLV